jgi:uncharacterized protein YaaQ
MFEGWDVRLLLAVVRAADVNSLLRDFASMGVFATQIEGDSTVGGMDLAAVLAGVATELVPSALAIIHAHAGGRARPVEPVRPIGERAESWVPGFEDQVAGGASVYVLPVRRFERIEYA